MWIYIIWLTNNYLKILDADKKLDDILVPSQLVPQKIVDDFEDVDKELEEELENMNLDEVETTVNF